jgi:Skp family chaperone for outer membrane proteins
MKENEISIIIDKKNVILGNAELDITKLIIEKLDKELPSLNLK